MSVSGPVTADLTTTVIHSSKLLINDVKPDYSLTVTIHYNYILIAYFSISVITINFMVFSSYHSCKNIIPPYLLFYFLCVCV